MLDLAFSQRGDAVLAWQRSLDEESADIRAAIFDAPTAATTAASATTSAATSAAPGRAAAAHGPAHRCC